MIDQENTSFHFATQFHSDSNEKKKYKKNTRDIDQKMSFCE